MPIPVSWPVIGGTPYSIPITGETNWGALTNYLVALATAQSTTSQKIGVRIATATPVTVVSASDAAVIVNLTVPGPATVQLPAGINGQTFNISDGKGDAGTNNITILPALGATINGSPSFIINSNLDAIGLIYSASNNNWKVITQILSFAQGSVARNAIAPGTPGYVVINDGTTGLLSEEQFLNQVRGGFGQNVSAFSGVVTALAGIFSATPDFTVFTGTSKEMLVGQNLFDLYPTGAKTFAGITVTGGGATFTVGAGTGQVVDHVTQQFFNVSWSAFTGQVPATPTGITFVYVTRSGTLLLTTAAPTGNSRRDNIFLARIGALSGTVIGFATAVTSSIAPAQNLADLAESISAFRVSGVIMSANGVNLNVNRSSGFIFQLGVNFVVDPNNPNIRTVTAATPTTLLYGTRSTVAGSVVTVIDPANYDPNPGGVVTPIPGSNARATIQRIYQFTGSGLAIGVQYGPQFYPSLTDAIQAVGTEAFTVNPNFANNAILVSVLCVTKGCNDLSDTTTARFLPVSRFGESAVGASGVSVSTLQNTYDNSAVTEILTDITRGALTIRRGSLADTDTVIEGANGTGIVTFSATGEGTVTSAGGVVLQSLSGTRPNLKLFEDSANGVNKITIQAPGTLAADYTLTLPVDDGISGQVLQTDGVGVLGWTAAATSNNPIFTGSIGVPDGTVLIPALAFTSDADGTGTGIYRVAANSLGFSANGVNVGQYNSSGAWALTSSLGSHNFTMPIFTYANFQAPSAGSPTGSSGISITARNVGAAVTSLLTSDNIGSLATHAYAAQLFYVNYLNTGASEVLAGAITPTGAWTWGPPVGLGTGAAAYHKVFGSIVGNSATGLTRWTISHIDGINLSAGTYRDSAAVVKAIQTTIGYSTLLVTRSTSATAITYQLLTNYQDNQPIADQPLITTNQKTVHTITAEGTHAFGATGLTTSHTVNGAIDATNHPKVSAFRNGNISGIASNTLSRVNFNVEDFDTTNAYDSTTNFRLTPLVPGKYQISTGVALNTGSSGTAFELYIFKNGILFKMMDFIADTVAGFVGIVQLGNSILVDSNSTDYFEIFARVTTSSTWNILGSSSDVTWFTAHKVV